MIKTAVILAAGLGSRISAITKNKPKGFIAIDGMPIVEMSICKLIEAGVEKIIIGTGHLQEAYTELAQKYPQVICVYNHRYAITGSMYTLYNLRKEVSSDFILLESDLLYDRAALKILSHHHMPDVILATELTGSSDEVFVEVDKENLLVNMSKNKEELKNIYGELTGITKLSQATFELLCQHAQAALKVAPRLDYEQALVGIVKEVSIVVHRVSDLAWCEIDDKNHLERALTEVYPKIKADEAIFPMVKRNILLNPGPATTTDRVKYAQVVPDICPRERDFSRLMEFISLELTRFVATEADYTTVLFAGSGTAAVEAILSSVVGSDYVLIINNGAYGKRMCQMAQAYGLKYLEFFSAGDHPLNLVVLDSVIRNFPNKISHLALVHNETTTGLLNDAASVGRLCQEHKIQLILDAMSSFAAIPIDMAKMNISYLAASANKNLQGMAGVSFVVAHKQSLVQTKTIKPKNFYLHLYSQYRHFAEHLQMRFTPPVQTLYALKQAIMETKAEGIPQRYKRYSKSWDTLINGITGLGLSYLVKAKHHSKIVTAIVEPESNSYDFQEMHDYLYERGFTIYPGKLEGLNTFRVATIGDITCRDIDLFLELLQNYLHIK